MFFLFLLIFGLSLSIISTPKSTYKVNNTPCKPHKWEWVKSGIVIDEKEHEYIMCNICKKIPGRLDDT